MKSLLLAFRFAQAKPTICYYKILNVPTYANVTAIRIAYLDLVKKYHPDVTKEPNAAEKFNQIQMAYQILSEQKTRDQYDKTNKIDKQQHSQGPRTSEQLHQIMDQIKAKHLEGDQNKYKDQLNDQYNFTYKVLKDHYEKVQIKKQDYIKYDGNEAQYFELKDKKPDKLYRSYILLFFFPIFGIFLNEFGKLNPDQSKQI